MDLNQPATFDLANSTLARVLMLLLFDYLTPRRSRIDRTTHFSKSRWNGEIDEVTYRRDGAVMYRLDLGPLVDKRAST